MHQIYTEAIQLISSNLFITKEAIQRHLLLLKSYSELSETAAIPVYSEQAKVKCQVQTAYNITMDYSDSSLKDTIAFHYIAGTIYYDYYYWYFSTKRFMYDLLEAENNPGIIAHLILVNSGGGESYGIGKAVQVLADCKKPVIVLTEEMMASAALYLTLPATRIYASTEFDLIGSIGTMTAYWSLKSYYENLGMQFIEAYATESTHKNKKFHDLEKGEQENYIQTVLNPLQEAFHAAVAKYRPDTTKVPESAHIFNGETWYAKEAAGYGLIDGCDRTLEDCIEEAYNLGIQHKNKISTTNKLYSLID